MLLRNAFTRDARVLREARSLAAAGHEVTVLAIRVGKLPRQERVDGFRVLRAIEGKPWMGPTILGSGAPAAIDPRREDSIARRSSFSIAALSNPFLRPAVRIRDETIARLFARAGRHLRADVVHAHDLNTLGAGVSLAWAFRAKLVYDAHELYPDLTGLSGSERRYWRERETRWIRRADAVIAPTPARAAVLRDRYGITEPVVVMNCPDPPAGSGLGDLRLDAYRRDGERIVVYAGGFTPNRGLPGLIRAAGSLAGVRLVLLGWGPLEEELRRVAAPFGDSVVFAGAVDPDLVVPVCAGADVGVVSYEPVGLNNQLAAPNKLFEYLHAGLAIAGSDLPDVRAILERHRVGVPFDAGNEASIRAALTELRDADLASMRERARAAAPAYTWSRQAETLLALYSRLR